MQERKLSPQQQKILDLSIEKNLSEHPYIKHMEESSKVPIHEIPASTKAYYVLVRVYTPPEKTKGGILLTQQQQDREANLNVIGMVVAIGPSAFSNKTDFPDGPATEIGEWVIFPRHEGVLIKYKGALFRVFSDTRLVIGHDNPEEISPTFMTHTM